ncbi:MAG: putative Ig domain-containing protein [Bdellovibrionales bacterium]|nr:putative Ig domain-containing protein [Bdellovibrionales bacterium]
MQKPKMTLCVSPGILELMQHVSQGSDTQGYRSYFSAPLKEHCKFFLRAYRNFGMCLCNQRPFFLYGQKLFAAIAISLSLSGCFKNNGFDGLEEVSLATTSGSGQQGVFQFSSTGSLLPQAYTGDVYTVMLATSNGTEPVSYSVEPGTLPTGLTLTSYGLLSGMLSASPGEYEFSIRAVDGNGSVATKDFSLKISVPFTFTTRSIPNAVLGSSYSAVLTAVGGTPPYTYAATGLPTGFTLTPSIGLITGNPSATGTATLTVTVSDAHGWQRTGDILLNTVAPVSAIPSITNSTLPNGTVNSSYAGVVTAAGGVTPYRYAVASGSLPAGLTLDTNLGIISGTPTAAGVASFAIRVTDNLNSTTSQNYTLTIASPPAPNFTTTSLGNGVVGSSYAQVLAANLGAPPYQFSIQSGSGSLPAGLTIDSNTGIISGIPTAVGSSTFTGRVTDASGSTGTRSFSINVTAPPPPVITTSSLASATAGTSYLQVITLVQGIAPFNYEVLSGVLPAGLTLDSGSGIISGTPTSAGTFPFTVRVTDGVAATASKVYTMTVALPSGPTITTTDLASGTTGANYIQVLQTSGGTAPYTFSLNSGTLPAGLSLNTSNGTVSGIPTAAGTVNLSFRVTDANNLFSNKSLLLNIVAAASPQIANTSLPDAMVGTSYATVLSGVNGVTPYTYALISGTMPAGLNFDTGSGTISGTPTAAGTATLTFRITDSVGGNSTRSYSLLVGAPSPPAFVTTTLPSATTQSVYAQALNVTAGAQPFTFAVSASSGTLPPGISLNSSSGILSGTPTVAGTSNFGITVTDRVGATATQAFVLVVANPAAPVITTTTLASGTAGTPYMQVLQTSGGYAPLTLAIQNGTLPAGMSFTAGVLSGVPTVSGTGSITFSVTDALGSSTTKNLSLQILQPAAPVITTSSLSAGTQTVAYAQVIGATGGVPPYSFAITEGSLPAGLVLDSASGTITGTPTTAGSSSFTVRVTDTIQGTATKVFSLAIAAPSPPTFVNTTLSGGQVTVPYSQAVLISGGVAPYSFSVSGGALASGISLNSSTGALSGTPTAAGTFSFTVRVQDAASSVATQNYSLVVNPSPYAPLGFSATTLLPVIVNSANSRTINVTGGLPPYSYNLSFGSLPTGMSMNSSTGIISGTPTTSGSFDFTVQVTDNRATSASQSFSLKVVEPLKLTTPSLPGAISGVAYAAALAASGGTTPYSYSVVGLPSGLSSTSSGLISGSTTAQGSYSMSILVTDANGLSVQSALNLFVSTPLTITTSSLPNAGINETYSTTISTTGGVGPFNFTVSSGSLPTGLFLNSSTGAITGTPSPGANAKLGSAAVTISVSDASSQSASRSYSINVSIPPRIIKDIDGRLRTAAVGVQYLDNVKVTGGVGTLTYFASGLPQGLSLNTVSGYITGTPAASNSAGNYNASITVTDGRGFSTTRTKVIKLVASTGTGSFSSTKTGAFDTGVVTPLNPAPASAASTTRSNVQDAQLADMNGDGRPDFVYGIRSTSEVGVALNNGDGTFTNYFYTLTNSRLPSNIYIQDMDGDGRLDVIAIVRDTVSEIQIIKGDGNWTAGCTNQVCGSNLTRQTISAGLNLPQQVAFGDINGDGRLDLVASNDGAVGVFVFVNCGSLTTVSYSGASTTCNNTAQNIFNYYSGPSYVPASPNNKTRGVALVNLRNNGILDLVVTTWDVNRAVLVYQGTSTTAGTFPSNPTTVYNGFATSTAGPIYSTMDIDGDGNRDIVMGGNEGAYVVYGNGLGGFNGYTQLLPSDLAGGFWVKAGDIRGVGCADIVLGSSNSAVRFSTLIYQQTVCGSRSFPSRRVLSTGYSNGIALGNNLFGQGTTNTKLDLVVLSGGNGWANSRFTAYKNNGTSTAYDGTTTNLLTSVTTPVLSSSGPFLFAGGPLYDAYLVGAPNIGDLNNDGYNDFVFKLGGSSNVYLGNASGQFTLVPNSGITTGDISSGGYFSRQTLLADFNADGIQDYASANYNQNVYGSFSVSLGVGDGTFIVSSFLQIDAPTCTSNQGARSIAAGDLNRDGKLDLIIGHGCNNQSRVSIFLGQGDGTFATTPTILIPPSGSSVPQVFVADTDFDGFLDLAIGTHEASLILYRGKGDGTFFTPTSFAMGVSNGISSLEVADINNDGQLDYVFSSDSGASWTYLLGGVLGTGAFSGPALYMTNYNYNAARVVDWDDDGRLDVLAFKRGVGLQFFRNNGTASIFTNPAVCYSYQNHTQNNAYVVPAIGDLNGDGLPDMITGGLENQAYNSLGVSYNLTK